MALKTIRAKVKAAGGAVLALGLIIAGAGGWATLTLSDALTDSLRNSQALRAHSDADMMHDALRADVFAALLSSEAGTGVSLTQVKADIVDHAAEFRRQIQRGRALSRDPKIRAILAELEPKLNAYIASAETLVARAGTDRAAAVAGLPAFMRTFSTLEDAMGQASEAIEKAAASRARQSQDQTRLAEIVMALLAMVAVAFAAGFLRVSDRILVRPLGRVTDALRRLARGETNVALEDAGRGDEIGDMTKALVSFRDTVAARQAELEATDERQRIEAERAEMERLRDDRARAQNQAVQSLAAGLSALAEGDLTVRLNERFAEDYETLRRDYNRALESLNAALGAVAVAGGSVESSAGEIAAAADDLSRRTEHQAASLEETAAAMDEITATVAASAKNARQATSAAANARQAATRSGDIMADAVAAMSEIEGSSRQVGQIIGVIDEIAFQTNLLALNAGVEAARAGEAGRGFAVVASEVRSLAQRSAEAAKEIKALIAASADQVERGVRLVADTGKALDDIVVRVTEIDDLLEAVARSSQEQANGLNEVNSAVNQMDQATQQNAAMVEEATAAAGALRKEARELMRLVGRFTLARDAHSQARMRSAA